MGKRGVFSAHVWRSLLLAALLALALPSAAAIPSYGLVQLQNVLNKVPTERSVEFGDRVTILVGTFITPNETEIDFQRSLIQKQLDVLSRTIGEVVTIKHVFVLCAGTDVFGDDVVHLVCEESYQELFTKTYSFWTSISSLISADFYAKRDADAQICWLPVIRQLLKQAFTGRSVYMGGYTTNANVYSDPNHRWHDKFLVNLAPQQRNYWPYMQGAFYLMSASLVRILEKVKDRLQTLGMEDTMVGAWLLPFRKTIVHLEMEHRCQCQMNHAAVFHKCTQQDYLSRCSEEAHMTHCFGNPDIAGKIMAYRQEYFERKQQESQDPQQQTPEARQSATEHGEGAAQQ